MKQPKASCNHENNVKPEKSLHSFASSIILTQQKGKKKTCEFLYHPLLWREAGNSNNMTVILNCALCSEDYRSSGSQIKC